MNKKLLSFLLSVVISCSFLPATAVNTYAAEDDSAINTMVGLSIFEESAKAEPTETLTRAEFARILCNMMNLVQDEEKESDWFNGFFGEKEENTDLVIPNGAVSEYYNDVDMSTEYYEEIIAVTQRGIMNGVGDKTFAPDMEITTLQICATMIKMLGYTKYAEYAGGWSAGFIAMAESAGMTKGTNCSNNSATYRDAARIIYNSLENELLEISFIDGTAIYTSKEGKTLLSEMMGISKMTGVMTDNGVTTRAGESEVGIGFVVIGEQKLSLNNPELRKYIGYELTAYYAEESGELLYAEPTKKNDVITINAEDFVEYKDNSIYYLDGERGSKKRANVSAGATIIYNGSAKTTFTNNDFIFDEGTITLIAPENESVYKTISVEKYDNWFVSEVNEKDSKIYNRSQATGEAFMELEEGIKDGTALFYKADGAIATIADVTPASVISVAKSLENNQVVKIIIANESQTNLTVKGLYTEDGKEMVTFADGKDYQISDSFTSSPNKQTIRLNDNVNIYMNTFGNIAWIEKATVTDGIKVGYLVKIKQITDEAEEDYIVTIYSEDGRMEKYHLDEKVKWAYGDEKKTLKAEVIYKNLTDPEAYQGLVAYMINEDELITSIEKPTDERNKNGAFQKMVSYDDASNPDSWKTNGMNYNRSGSWYWFENGRIIFNNSTKIFKIPQNVNLRDDENMYDLGYTFKVNSQYKIKSYCFDDLTGLADYLVIEDDTATGDKFTYSSRTMQLILVSDMSQGLNADDEAGMIIKGYKIGYEQSVEAVELFAVADSTGIYPTENATSPIQNGKTYKVKKGDIIRVLTDVSGQYVEKVEKIFSLTDKNALTGKPGDLTGTVGWYSGTDPNNGYNPWTWVENNSDTKNGMYEKPVIGAGNTRVAYGYVYDVKDGLVYYTTQDITDGSKLDQTNTNYLAEHWIQIGQLGTITNVGKDYTMSKGLNDIKTYKEYGSDCSKIITVRCQQINSVAILINIDDE